LQHLHAARRRAAQERAFSVARLRPFVYTLLNRRMAILLSTIAKKLQEEAHA
jgi:hypothetical protein